ncbi:MAG: hypothetical protein GY743_23325 [Planctomycetaceae bacterium]|nr:hypothetical protein [Planctomycetaceae bacterium]
MYHYQGINPEANNSLSTSGTLVECLKVARRMYHRQGMVGTITRPDGTSLRECARRVACPAVAVPVVIVPFVMELEDYLTV